MPVGIGKLSNQMADLGRVIKMPLGRVVRRVKFLAHKRDNQPVVLTQALRRVPCFSQEGFRRVIGDYPSYVRDGNTAHLTREAIVGLGYFWPAALANTLRQDKENGAPDHLPLTVMAASKIDFLGNALSASKAPVYTEVTRQQSDAFAWAKNRYPLKNFAPTQEERILLIISLLLMGYAKFCYSKNARRREIGKKEIDMLHKHLERISEYFRLRMLEGVSPTSVKRPDTAPGLLRILKKEMPKSLQVIGLPI